MHKMLKVSPAALRRAAVAVAAPRPRRSPTVSARRLAPLPSMTSSFSSLRGVRSAVPAPGAAATTIGDRASTSTAAMMSAVTPFPPAPIAPTSRASSSASAPYDQRIDAFPSLVIGSNSSIEPRGPFAEAQATFLEPHEETVDSLVASLDDANAGIVAHFYMDVELQGILHAGKNKMAAAAPNSSPRIAIADSLAMGDDAVEMCRSGATSIICLGVDFMSESVAAILDRNGYGHIPVYRATTRHIGCSLAEAAERDSYRAWLTKEREDASRDGGAALHVVYINTSLETKATCNSIVPTITCTSSNVLPTMLQASAQLGPDKLRLLYGPDTYMGQNLVALFDAVLSAGWSDERIARDLHPEHNRETIQQLRNNLKVFPSGNCVVHHMFGGEVSRTVREKYSDAYVSAHLEVPGEMFQIALEKSLTDDGVVGSTSNILHFISRKVEEAVVVSESKSDPEMQRLKFILGTEAGMVTSIVKAVQGILDSKDCAHVEAEIIFPVSSEAVMGVDEEEDAIMVNASGDVAGGNNAKEEMKVVPGAAGGEGCSTSGGCATCPFMKMNDVDTVTDLLEMITDGRAASEATLRKHLPPQRLKGKMIGGIDAIEWGIEPIVNMRHFMKEKRLADDLVKKICDGCITDDLDIKICA